MSGNKKIKVGVIGGAGYTAGELLRILVYHPEVEITFVQSESQTGKPVYSIHKDLLGNLDVHFVNELEEVDAIFLCRGHGQSKAFLESQVLPGNPKIIDLSHDYRLQNSTHEFIYGLPEAYREDIQNADELANPGCFATCIQLGLVPLAANNELRSPIHVTAITGSTGAGQSLSETSHFSWRNNNLSVYKPFNHQHLGEINQTLNHLQDEDVPPINFVPVRGDFTRGIFASIYLETDLSLEKAQELFMDHYTGHMFSFVSTTNPDLKQVVGTNKGVVHLQKIDGKLLIISIIDNLIKGASGQAVQNMNLMFGLDEDAGLRLKSMVF